MRIYPFKALKAVCVYNYSLTKQSHFPDSPVPTAGCFQDRPLHLDPAAVTAPAPGRPPAREAAGRLRGPSLPAGGGGAGRGRGSPRAEPLPEAPAPPLGRAAPGPVRGVRGARRPRRRQLPAEPWQPR